MSNTNLNLIKVVDPLLSSSVGDVEPSGYILDRIAPPVEVYTSTFSYRTFGKEKLRKQPKTTRPLGGNTERSNSQYSSKSGKVVEHSLKEVLDQREIADALNAGNPNASFDIRMDKARLVKSQILQEKEAAAATLIMDNAQYAAANKSATAAADLAATGAATGLRKVVHGKRSVVRRKWGVRPNCILLTPDAFDIAIENADVKNQLQYTSSDTPDEQMLARFLGVEEVIVPQSVVLDDADAGSDIWTGTKMLLFYRNTQAGLSGVTFAKTFTRKINGLYGEVSTAYDMEGNEHIFYREEYDTELIHADAAFLWY